MLEKSDYKFLIIGAFKCGQTSLVKYLKNRFKCEVLKLECIYNQNLPNKDWVKTYKDYTKIIIIRRDENRALLSNWRFFEAGMQLDEYKKLNEGKYDYYKWIKKWSIVNPIVLELEDMKLNPNFSNENKNVTNPIPSNYLE